MGPRWRKVRSDLVSNRARSLLAIISLAVGTMAVGAMHLASTAVDASLESGFLAANPPSAVVGTTSITAELVDRVRDHPAVSEAEGRRLVRTRAVAADGGSVVIELVAMDFGANTVARIEPEQGSWPPGDDQLVLEGASRGELGVAVGDVVSVDHPDQEPIDLQVAGTAFDVYEMAPLLGGPVRGYVSLDTMVRLTGSGALDTLYLRAADEPLDRDQAVATTVAVRDDVLAPAGVTIEVATIQDPAEHRADNALSFLVRAMQLLALLAVVIAVTLVINTVSAILAQQRRQVGVMKAIGATSAQLVIQYLGYVLLLALAALLVAVPLALLGGRFLAGSMADLANFALEPLEVPWTTLALMAAVAVLLPVLAVIATVRRAALTTVQDAISDRGLHASGQAGRVALPVSRPTVLAYRNAVRSRSRLALTVVTIALCGAVLVGVLSTQRALGNLTDQMAGYWDYDVEVALTDPRSTEDAAAVVGADEAVTSVEGWYRTQAFRIRPDGTENENINITGAPVDSPSLDPTLIDGRWFGPADDHPVVINTHFADEEPDLAVGDRVDLDIEGQRRSWTIVGISTTTLVGPVAFVPVDALTATLGRPGETNLVAVELEPGGDPAAAAARLETAARDGGLPLAEVRTHADLQAAVGDLLVIFVALLLSVGAVLVLVAVVGVAGTMTLNVAEQTREIGVLRTLGASSGAIRRLFLLQGLAVAFAGGLLGVVLSVPVAMLLQAAISDGLIGAALPGGFSWIGVGIWGVVAVGIGVLGATRPARVAARLTISETLAYE
jgi:putative ABC transport system permease protein